MRHLPRARGGPHRSVGHSVQSLVRSLDAATSSFIFTHKPQQLPLRLHRGMGKTTDMVSVLQGELPHNHTQGTRLAALAAPPGRGPGRPHSPARHHCRPATRRRGQNTGTQARRRRAQCTTYRHRTTCATSCFRNRPTSTSSAPPRQATTRIPSMPPWRVTSVVTGTTPRSCCSVTVRCGDTLLHVLHI